MKDVISPILNSNQVYLSPDEAVDLLLSGKPLSDKSVVWDSYKVFEEIVNRCPEVFESIAADLIYQMAQSSVASKGVQLFLPRTGSNFLSLCLYAQKEVFVFSERADFPHIIQDGGVLGSECGLSYNKLRRSAIRIWKQGIFDVRPISDPARNMGYQNIFVSDNFDKIVENLFQYAIKTHNLFQKYDIKLLCVGLRHPWPTFLSLKKLQPKLKDADIEGYHQFFIENVSLLYAAMLTIADTLFTSKAYGSVLTPHESLLTRKGRQSTISGTVVRSDVYVDPKDWVKNHPMSDSLEGFGYMDPRRNVIVEKELSTIKEREVDFISETEELCKRLSGSNSLGPIASQYLAYYKNLEVTADDK